MQTDVKSSSGRSIKLLFCCSLYGTSHSFAILCDFILRASEDRKIFTAQGCRCALSPFPDGVQPHEATLPGVEEGEERRGKGHISHYLVPLLDWLY